MFECDSIQHGFFGVTQTDSPELVLLRKSLHDSVLRTLQARSLVTDESHILHNPSEPIRRCLGITSVYRKSPRYSRLPESVLTARLKYSRDEMISVDSINSLDIAYLQCMLRSTESYVHSKR